MNNNQISWRIDVLLEFGEGSSLVFYTVRPMTATGVPPNHSIYWKDKDSPEGHGPFSHLYAAGDHYRRTIESRKHWESIPDSPVIQVDFHRKKRL